MTIDELIERLQEYRDEIGGDAEVRLMTQQKTLFNFDRGLDVPAATRSMAGALRFVMCYGMDRWMKSRSPLRTASMAKRPQKNVLNVKQ
jgi:hypothetical protein